MTEVCKKRISWSKTKDAQPQETQMFAELITVINIIQMFIDTFSNITLLVKHTHTHTPKLGFF